MTVAEGPRAPWATRLAAALVIGAALAACSREEPAPQAAAPAAPAPPPPPAPALAPARAWALATSAVLTERNRERHDLLAGGPRIEARVREWRENLVEWWGVESRADLLETLERLDADGHRREFERLGAALERMSDAEIRALLASRGYDDEISQRVEVVTRWYGRLGAKSLLGWDYARYVSLCRWGYLVGYLSEEEAWARIMPVARRLQRAFTSWRELGENYLIGRQFWSLSETRESGRLTEEAYRKLLEDPKSPWTRLPWDTSLTDG